MSLVYAAISGAVAAALVFRLMSRISRRKSAHLAARQEEFRTLHKVELERVDRIRNEAFERIEKLAERSGAYKAMLDERYMAPVYPDLASFETARQIERIMDFINLNAARLGLIPSSALPASAASPAAPASLPPNPAAPSPANTP